MRSNHLGSREESATPSSRTPLWRRSQGRWLVAAASVGGLMTAAALSAPVALAATGTITTQLSTSNLTLNTPLSNPGGVSDVVTVTGVPNAPGHFVYVDVYKATGNPPTPTGPSLATWEVPLGTNSQATTPLFVPESAGNFCFVATFKGDLPLAQWLTSSCESLTVNKFQASLVTDPVTPTSGSDLSDSATMTMYPTKPAEGGSGDYGSVVFTLYSDSSCMDPVTNGQTSGTIAYTSGAMQAQGALSFTTPLASGTYYWVAHYGGNYDNLAYTSSCGEPTTVNGSGTLGAQTPSISTQLSASTITAGGTAYDTAKLTNASSDAGGTVTYTVYSQSSCSSSSVVQSAGQVTVTNAAVPPSNTVSFASAGTFYWQAFYSGDGNNAAATSSCTSEALVVNSSGSGSGTPPASGTSAASTTTPTTGAGLMGPGLMGGAFVLLGLVLLAGARLSRRLGQSA